MSSLSQVHSRGDSLSLSGRPSYSYVGSAPRSSGGGGGGSTAPAPPKEETILEKVRKGEIGTKDKPLTVKQLQTMQQQEKAERPKAAPTPGKAKVTSERVTIDPKTGKITDREITYGRTEVETRKVVGGTEQVVGRRFQPSSTAIERAQYEKQVARIVALEKAAPKDYDIKVSKELGYSTRWASVRPEFSYLYGTTYGEITDPIYRVVKPVGRPSTGQVSFPPARSIEEQLAKERTKYQTRPPLDPLMIYDPYTGKYVMKRQPETLEEYQKRLGIVKGAQVFSRKEYEKVKEQVFGGEKQFTQPQVFAKSVGAFVWGTAGDIQAYFKEKKYKEIPKKIKTVPEGITTFIKTAQRGFTPELVSSITSKLTPIGMATYPGRTTAGAIEFTKDQPGYVAGEVLKFAAASKAFDVGVRTVSAPFRMIKKAKEAARLKKIKEMKGKIVDEPTITSLAKWSKDLDVRLRVTPLKGGKGVGRSVGIEGVAGVEKQVLLPVKGRGVLVDPKKIDVPDYISVEAKVKEALVSKPKKITPTTMPDQPRILMMERKTKDLFPAKQFQEVIQPKEYKRTLVEFGKQVPDINKYMTADIRYTGIKIADTSGRRGKSYRRKISQTKLEFKPKQLEDFTSMIDFAKTKQLPAPRIKKVDLMVLEDVVIKPKPIEVFKGAAMEMKLYNVRTLKELRKAKRAERSRQMGIFAGGTQWASDGRTVQLLKTKPPQKATLLKPKRVKRQATILKTKQTQRQKTKQRMTRSQMLAGLSRVYGQKQMPTFEYVYVRPMTVQQATTRMAQQQKIKQSLRVRTGLITSQTQKLAQSQRLVSLQAIKPVQALKPAQKQIQISKQAQALRQKLSYQYALRTRQLQKLQMRTKQKTVQKLRTSTILRSTTKTVTSRTPRPPKPPIPIPSISKQTVRDTMKRREEIAGYVALIKRKLKKTNGRYVTRGYEQANKKPLTKKAAQGLVMKIVDKYANRSGYVRRVSNKGKKRKDLIRAYSQLRHKFRQSKVNRNVLVERRKFAIDTRQEVKDIPYKGIKVRTSML